MIFIKFLKGLWWFFIVNPVSFCLLFGVQFAAMLLFFLVVVGLVFGAIGFIFCLIFYLLLCFSGVKFKKYYKKLVEANRLPTNQGIPPKEF